MTRCLRCKEGETTLELGAASCSSCDLGRFGVPDRTCIDCPENEYQDERKKTSCKTCKEGRIPNEQQTACETPPWTVPTDCALGVQYLNNTDTDEMAWKCQSCPEGALCRGDRTFHDIQGKQGYWRIPWSKHNITFERCPYYSDCLGVSEESGSNSTYSASEGCLVGTQGPLCSLCVEGYNRDINECVACTNTDVPLRIAVFVMVLLLLFLLARQCKKKMERKLNKYKPLWDDVMSVIGINITFAQINSSLPSVIEVVWPKSWSKFVKYFSFVNIDVMSLIGVNCISRLDYYMSFAVMMCVPLGIFVMALTNYCCSMGIIAHQFDKMTEDAKEEKKKEALHALFELADGDHSGFVDPSELAEIMQSLGWKIKLKVALALAEKLGGQLDDMGMLVLTEDQFVKAMISGKIATVLKKINVRKMSIFGSKSDNSSNVLTNSDQLVRWTLRSRIIASSLSGAMQLLLLAHTPVSRKVFQYFHCNDLAGRSLLVADYMIDCNSSEYYAFMPLVLIVLVGFTVALPFTISLYFMLHWNDLYTTRTHQRMGWLYEPFVRGAEFWQVHDLLMKMVLTVSAGIIY